MKRRLAVIAVLALSLIAYQVLADPNAPTALNEGTSSSRNLSQLATQTVNAQGGNVTQLNISALSITQSWQGYYGNVTGVITLGDSNNNTFYNWSASAPSGQIFATRAAAPDWSTINCTNSTEITTEEGALGQTASDADSVSNTYSFAASHPGFSVGSSSIIADDCAATNAFDNSGSQTSAWFQMLLSDGSGNIAYTTLINDSTTGFDGNSWDFQLLVGEDNHAGSPSATQYYFWVELN